MKEHESKLIRFMLRTAFAEGWMASVWDGEAWTVKKSRDVEQVLAACGTTDDDRIRFRDASGVKMGSVLLVYGNGPGEVVSDYSDLPTMRKVMDLVMEEADRIEREPLSQDAYLKF